MRLMRARLALVGLSLGLLLVAACAATSHAPSPTLPRSAGEGVRVVGAEPARSRIERTAREALPVLEQVIGSRWPRDFAPRIVVVPSRAEAAGELGFFDVAREEIRVVPYAPSWLVVHELAHAWFGAPHSHDRRANEGRATAAALRVLHACPDLGDEEWLRASLLQAAASVPAGEVREPPSPLPATWTEADERRKNAYYAQAWLESERAWRFEAVAPALESHPPSSASVVATGEIVKVEARSDGLALELAVTTRSGFDRDDTFWNFELVVGDRKLVAGLGRSVDPWLGETTGLADPALVEWRPLHRSRLGVRGTRAVLTFPRAMIGARGRIEVRGYLVRGEKRVEETQSLSIE